MCCDVLDRSRHILVTMVPRWSITGAMVHRQPGQRRRHMRVCARQRQRALARVSHSSPHHRMLSDAQMFVATRIAHRLFYSLIIASSSCAPSCEQETPIAVTRLTRPGIPQSWLPLPPPSTRVHSSMAIARFARMPSPTSRCSSWHLLCTRYAHCCAP